MNVALFSLPIAVFVLRIVFIALLAIFLAVLTLAMRRNLAGAIEASPRTNTETLPTQLLALVVVEPGPTTMSSGHRFAVRNPLVIGRGTSNDINIDDTFVSNHHARLAQISGIWHLEDLGSTNGTRLNGEPIKGTVPVTIGDTLGIGRVTLRLIAS